MYSQPKMPSMIAQSIEWLAGYRDSEGKPKPTSYFAHPSAWFLFRGYNPTMMIGAKGRRAPMERSMFEHVRC
jgi:hypothetical protein